MSNARSLRPKNLDEVASGRYPALRSSTDLPALRAPVVRAVPRPNPKPKPARRPASASDRLVFEMPAKRCDFAFEDDVEDVPETPDSMLELQMNGMKVTEEAWPAPRAVPPPLPQLGPMPKISQTKNRAIRPPPLPNVVGEQPPPRASAPQLAAADPIAVIEAFAAFGPPPKSIFGMPGYALRVRARRRILARELAALRARRSADVELYEQAMQTANGAAVRAGYALIVFAPVFVGAIVFALLIALGVR